MISSFEVTNFTGGLNLRADVFNLSKDESPDLLNVDIDPRGGFTSRWGFTSIGGTVNSSSGVYPVKIFYRNASTNQVIVSVAGSIKYGSGTSWTDMGIYDGSIWGASFATYHDSNNYTYIVRGTPGVSDTSYKWDGSTATSLTASGTGQWQDDLLSPTGTHMPYAEHIAVHNERVWVAYTKEDLVTHPDRIRFSHPLFPESWRQQDYIDVVGGGLGIRAIIPYADHLLVFKPRGIYAIFGYDSETFQVVTVTRELGVESPNSVCGSADGVYFFSYPEGLYLYGGGSIRDKFEKLRPMIEAGLVNTVGLNSVCVSRYGSKIFLSLPYGSDVIISQNDVTYDETVAYDDETISYYGGVDVEVSSMTFVLDESVGKNGAWTKYRLGDGYGLGPGTLFRNNDGNESMLFFHGNSQYVLEFDSTAYDDSIDGARTPFPSYFYTSWFDANSSRNKKFWRRPEFVLNSNEQTYDVDVDVYHDWNNDNRVRSFTLSSDNSPIVVSGDVGSNNVENNINVLAEFSNLIYGSNIVYGGTIGSCRSCQLKFTASSVFWGVNGINFRLSNKGVKI